MYVVGNLPYYITSPIIEHLINNIKSKKMVFMVQKEVADRYSAKVNTKEYGYFTLFLNFYYEVNNEIFVSKNNFDPIPKVDSEVISLSLKDKVPDINPEKYFAFLKECFSHKRKTLKNNIISYDYEKIMNVLNKYGLKTLAKGEKGYVDVYEGDGFRRDSSYHQGITWPWLLGLYYDTLKNMVKTEKDKTSKKELQIKLNEFIENITKTFTKELY